MSDKELHIPNLHPSHRTTTSHSQDDYEDTTELGRSFQSRIGSFVGSYSRTSLMHMAENVVVSDGNMVKLKN